MVSIYDLKPKFQALLRPLCAKLSAAGVTANQVTVFALLLSCVGGGAIALYPTEAWPFLLLPFILFLRMALNALDGMLAREFGMKSDLGAILNELGDVISDAVLYLPFALVSGISIWGVFIFVLLATMTELAGILSVQIGGSRRYDGPFGKSDRAFAMGVLSLFIWLGIPYEGWVNFVVFLMCALSAWTVVKRARSALAEDK